MELEYAQKEQVTKQLRNLNLSYTYITYRVGVYVGSGSRNEDLETSGTAYLLEKMFLRGTSNKSKSEIAHTIEGMGGRWVAETERETSRYGL